MKGTSNHFDCLTAMRALGEPARFTLVRRLVGGPRSVTELCEETGILAYNVSKHLRVLKEAGLVEVHKLGQKRIYQLSEAVVQEISRNSGTLDLGCCQFHLNRIPEQDPLDGSDSSCP